MVETKNSLWARSTLFRIVCYSAASSLLLCLIAEFFWSLNRPTSWSISSGSPFVAHLRELAIIACVIFWLTFAVLGGVLGVAKASRQALAILIPLFLLLSAVLFILVIPVADCPNCTGPPEKQAEGTHGVIIDGNVVTTGCWGCNGRRLTLYRKWTWSAPD